MKISDLYLAAIVIAAVAIGLATTYSGFITSCTDCPTPPNMNLTFMEKANESNQIIQNLTNIWSSSYQQSLWDTAVQVIAGLPIAIYNIIKLVMFVPGFMYTLISDTATVLFLPSWFTMMVVGLLGAILVFEIIRWITRTEA